MPTIHADSHVDHLPKEVLSYILAQLEGRPDGFFIESLLLPESLPTVESALYGPICGDKPLEEVQVYYDKRPGRAYPSRLIDAPARSTRLVTVIVGPHGEFPSVLYTAFGGPLSAKEVNDPTLKEEEREKSVEFWAQHALAVPQPK